MEKEFPLTFEDIIPNPEGRRKEIESAPSPISLLLDHPELPRNIAAINRLADAARIDKMYVFGYPPPEKKRKKTERISRNAIEKLPVSYLSTIEEVNQLANQKRLIALEYTNKSMPFNAYRGAEPCILVVGNERSGVSKEILALCEHSLHIPMLGRNSSMNVAVATGIVVYHLLGNMKKI